MAARGAARLFAGALRDVFSVPGSASIEKEYEGSRQLNQRFEYSENSTAGFVELAPDRIPSHQQFFTALKSAPDVERVEWKETKTSQGNGGNTTWSRTSMCGS